MRNEPCVKRELALDTRLARRAHDGGVGRQPPADALVAEEQGVHLGNIDVVGRDAQRFDVGPEDAVGGDPLITVDKLQPLDLHALLRILDSRLGPWRRPPLDLLGPERQVTANAPPDGLDER